MNVRSTGLAALIVLLLATPSLSAKNEAARGPLDALGWMSGSWSGRQGDVTSEEHWTSPSANLMVSMHRDVKAGRAVSFEFLRIVARGDTITYVAMPRGRNETSFPLKELGAKRVVFENPEHDFPQRVLYWREGEQLVARIEGTIKGKERGEEWRFSRVK